jgi:hypothetical protein
VDQTPKYYHIHCGREAWRAARSEQKESEKKFLSTSLIRCFFCGRCDAVSGIASQSRSKLSRLEPAASSQLDVRAEIARLPRPSKLISARTKSPLT